MSIALRLKNLILSLTKLKDMLQSFVKRRETEQMVRRVCAEEGATPDQTELIVAVIYAESGMNPKAVNRNRDAKGNILSTDYGIAQFNDFWWIGAGKPIASADEALNNPEKCIRVMYGIVRKPGGIKNWCAFTNGSYLRFYKRSQFGSLIMNSTIFNFNWRDLGMSVVNGVFVGVIGYLATLTNIMDISTSQLFNVVVLAIIGSLAKKFSTDQNGKVFGKI